MHHLKKIFATRRYIQNANLVNNINLVLHLLMVNYDKNYMTNSISRSLIVSSKVVWSVILTIFHNEYLHYGWCVRHRKRWHFRFIWSCSFCSSFNSLSICLLHWFASSLYRHICFQKTNKWLNWCIRRTGQQIKGLNNHGSIDI